MRVRVTKSAITPRAALVLWLLSGAACSSSSGAVAKAPGAAKGTQKAESVIELGQTVVSPFSDEELAQQFEQGRAHLQNERYAEAGEVFDRLLRLAPDGQTAPPSTLNRGIAHDGLGERERGIVRYQDFLKRWPEHPLAKLARARMARGMAYLELWSELLETAKALLSMPDLLVLEAVEAHGFAALALSMQNRTEEASRAVMRARDLIDEHHLGESAVLPKELSPVYFALGEVRRAKSEALKFKPLPPDFSDVLEKRCQGLLDAQNAYAETMRANDAHWSAMAGFRMGQLYEQLHRDLVGIEPPANAQSLKQKQLFEAAMRLRYRVLLEKGLRAMEAVVNMGKRTGESSLWISRAKDAQKKLEQALGDEKAALAKMPFTEEEIKRELELLKGK